MRLLSFSVRISHSASFRKSLCFVFVLEQYLFPGLSQSHQSWSLFKDTQQWRVIPWRHWKITNLVKITRLRGESESRKRGSKVVMKTTRSKSREDAEAKEEEPIYNFDEASIRVSFTRKVWFTQLIYVLCTTNSTITHQSGTKCGVGSHRTCSHFFFLAHSAYFNNFRQKIPYFDASRQKRVLFYCFATKQCLGMLKMWG